jgi:hypothetical protein
MLPEKSAQLSISVFATSERRIQARRGNVVKMIAKFIRKEDAFNRLKVCRL